MLDDQGEKKTRGKIPIASHEISSPPKVTVLMPVGPLGRDHLAAALRSMQEQDYPDLEILLIDDSPEQGLKALLAGANLDRVRIVPNVRSRGVAGALNTGLDMISGVYVARMDADDISLPGRIRKQVAYLESHPEIGVLGSTVERFGAVNEIFYPPFSHTTVRTRLLFENCIVHPSVMFRAALLKGEGICYDEEPEARHAEDYDLWRRLVLRTRIVNLSEVLLRYRVHSGQVGKTATEDQCAASDRIRAKMLFDAGCPASPEQVALHNRIAAHNYEPTREFVEKSEAWLRALVQWSQKEPDFDDAEMSRLAGRALYQICNYCCRWVDGLFTLWRRSPLCVRLSLPEYFRFRMKTVLFPRT